MKDKVLEIRKKLKNGKVSLGTWQQIPNASISEILGNARYDWVAVDMEHGSISVDQLPNMIRAIELGNSLPLVRVAQSVQKDCRQALDAGAKGLILPMIESGEQLNKIMDFCCLPPMGKRGIGYSRANLFGKYFNNYINQDNDPLIIAQIESINAVNNLNDIINNERLDSIMIGPYDLSASLGITGDFNNSKFSDIIKHIINLSLESNMPLGDHIVNPDIQKLNERIKQGFQFIAYGTDAVFLYTAAKTPNI